jgi:hypothetical protein
MPWAIVASFTCTSLANYAEARKSAVETLKAKTPYAVARELWTGAESGSPSLQSTATDVSAASAQPAEVVLSELGANFDECSGGAQPTFHVPSRLIYQLMGTQVVTRVGDRLMTPTGGIVIPGPGYPNTPGEWGPNASPGPVESAEGEAFIYVTGPVELDFSETWESGSGEPPVATFARLNRSELFVQRDAIFRFPTCCVFGALGRHLGMSDAFGLSEADVAELLAILDTPDEPAGAHRRIGGRKRKCKRTPLHPHCKSIRWGSLYRALRRKGKSKKNAAQISNAMYNRWLQGRIVRKDFT